MKSIILASTMLMPLLPLGQAAMAEPCGAGLSMSQGATMLGTMVGDPGTDGGKENNRSFTAAMGRQATLIDTYVDDSVMPDKWADSANYSASGIAQLGDPKNIIPVIGIPMAIVGHKGDDDFKAIIRGDWDIAIQNTFQIYVDHGFLGFYIRPGWEMNGDWYPWSVNPSNAADFAAAFAHITDLAHKFQNALIAVMWNPGYVPNASASFMSYFPGADKVDSIGIDTYGAASGVPDTAPFATPNPNAYTLQDAIALAKSTDRPLSLPETGGGPGDTAFPENLAKVIVESGVKVDAIIIWDDYYGLATSGHWSDDPAASGAWKQAFTAIAASSAAASGGGSNCAKSATSSPAATTAAVTIGQSPTTTRATVVAAVQDNAASKPSEPQQSAATQPAPPPAASPGIAEQQPTIQAADTDIQKALADAEAQDEKIDRRIDYLKALIAAGQGLPQ
jgi:hypothetical protein